VGGYPIHPLGSASEPPYIRSNLLIYISETGENRIKWFGHLGNAGLEQSQTSPSTHTEQKVLLPADRSARKHTLPKG
jgi:hypothetical protein